MSKFTKVTKQNAHLILFRINKFLSQNNAITHYSDWGKYPKMMNKLGIPVFDKQKFVEKTLTGYILKSRYSIRNYEYGIIINTSSDTFIGIHFGDKVKITPNRLFVKGFDNTTRKSFTSYFTPTTDIDKAENYYHFEERASKSYWLDVEADWNKEEVEMEIAKGDI